MPGIEKESGRDVYRQSFDHEVLVITLPPGGWTLPVQGFDMQKGTIHIVIFLAPGESIKDRHNREIIVSTRRGSDTPKDYLHEVKEVRPAFFNVIDDTNPNDIFFEWKAAAHHVPALGKSPAFEGRQTYTVARAIKGEDGLHLILPSQLGIPVSPTDRQRMIEFTRAVKLEKKRGW